MLRWRWRGDDRRKPPPGARLFRCCQHRHAALKQRYQHLVRLLAAMCAEPIRFEIHALTAEEDRVVAEASSLATLIDGSEYRMDYVFVLRIRNGRIAPNAEHFNALVAQEKLVPLMAEAAARLVTQ